MRFDTIQKTQKLIQLLNSPDVKCYAVHESHHDLMMAREYEKSQQWLEACEVYLDWIVHHFSYATFDILRAFFICLAQTDNFGNQLCIYLGNHLLSQNIKIDNEILYWVLTKVLNLGDFEGASQLFYQFCAHIPPESLAFPLRLMECRILKKLQRYTPAKILVENLKVMHNQLLLNLLIEVQLEEIELDLITGNLSKAEQLIHILMTSYPDHFDIKISLIKLYLLQNNFGDAEVQLYFFLKHAPLNLKALKIFLDSEVFMHHPIVLQWARDFMSQSIKKDEIQTVRMIMTSNTRCFEEKRNMFEQLLTVYHQPKVLLSLLEAFSQQHHQLELALEYQKKLQILNEKRIKLPNEVLTLFQEISTHLAEPLFLVGGSVVSLLTSQIIASVVDFDFVYVSDKKNIPYYVKSKYIPDLYIRNTRQLGGFAVDLKLISFSPEFLLHDANSRDFTICAIYCNGAGELFDPTGRGIYDLLNKKLDTILEPQVTLLADPVRIIRAFKYIARGYQPSDGLRHALMHLPMDLNLSENSHFNQVLIKECRSFYYFEFFKVLGDYDFLKHLSYCYPDVEGKDPRIIGQRLIGGLQNIVNKDNRKKHLPVSIMETVREDKQEKTQKLAALKLKLAEEKNKTISLASMTKSLKETFKKDSQSEIKKVKYSFELQSKMNKTNINNLELELQTLEKKINDLDVKVERERKASQQAYVQYERIRQANIFVQKSFPTLQQQVSENFKPPHVEQPDELAFLNNSKANLSEYVRPYALEQMVRVVSIKSLKAYLHAYIAIKELSQPPEKQNIFKIHNHLKGLMAFLPQESYLSYDPIVSEILSKLALLPLAEVDLMIIKQLADEALQNLQTETAIYYYHQMVHHPKGVPENKLYLEAHLHLAKLYLKHKDPMHLEWVLNKLQAIPKLPTEINQEIKNIYLNLESTLQKFKSIHSRPSTFFGFLDFWPLAINQMNYFQRHKLNPMTLEIKQQIYEQIAHKTLYQEEFILAQIEYAQWAPSSLVELQFSQIENFESSSQVVGILKDYAAQNQIPDKLLLILCIPMRQIQVLQSVSEIYPGFTKDIDLLELMFRNTQNERLKTRVSMILGEHFLNKGLLWQAKYYFEWNNLNALVNSHIQHIDAQMPLICWDSTDDELWFNYAMLHRKTQEIALYCLTKTIEVAPYNILALIELFKLQIERKQFRAIQMIYMQIMQYSELQIELSQLGRLSRSDIVEYNFNMQLFTQEHQRFGKFKDMFLNLAKKLKPDAQETIKRKLHANWMVISTSDNHTPEHEDSSISFLYAIIAFSYIKQQEYAFAHFELALSLYLKKNPNYILHFKEAVKISYCFETICPEFNSLEFIENPALYQELNCFRLYQEHMQNQLKNETRPYIFVEYFTFLISKGLSHLIQLNTLKIYLALVGLDTVQKAEAKILAQDYQQASDIMQMQSLTMTASIPRIFSWTPTHEAMQDFLLIQLTEYADIVRHIEDVYLKQVYLNKLVNLAEYLKIQIDENEFTSIGQNKLR